MCARFCTRNAVPPSAARGISRTINILYSSKVEVLQNKSAKYMLVDQSKYNKTPARGRKSLTVAVRRIASILCRVERERENGVL